MRNDNRRKKQQEIVIGTSCLSCGKPLTESEYFISDKCVTCETSIHKMEKQVKKWTGKDIDDLIN